MKRIALIIPIILLMACGKKQGNQNLSDSSLVVKDTSGTSAKDSAFKPAYIHEQMIYRRAIEAVNWVAGAL